MTCGRFAPAGHQFRKLVFSFYLFSAFSSGLIPVERIFTSFFSISNQNGAPCMAANPVIKTPNNLVSTSQSCGAFPQRLQVRLIDNPYTSFPCWPTVAGLGNSV